MKIIRTSIAQSLQTIGVLSAGQVASFISATNAVDALMDMIDQSGGATVVDLNPVTSTGAITAYGISACVSAGLITSNQATTILAY